MNMSSKRASNLSLAVATTPESPSRRTLIVALGGSVLAASASSALAGPVYHKLVMQGQVLSVDGDSLVVCIGDAAGAEVGQELKLVRHVRDAVAPKAGGPGFHRESIGTVRIAKIFNEHYASAEVVQGSARENDMVELESK